ncbi:Rne/Rng family ribonuclease [Rubeoparvulum massiliense]|uniref:Rne/Rng family ribonuclease n=1 Tax=Rubeoparvulum massiliense TaxID=1631346 RepID=UPI00065E7D98|nr:Rne/Rng family ribonuclease [Rubeoparvulum massiliense]
MKRLLINASGTKLQAALLDQHKLVELWYERSEDEQIIGNIYLGKVTDVLPGMEAAFVDIGLPKHAYLHVKDAIQGLGTHFQEGPLPTISQLVRQGEEVLVQVKKEGTEYKGPKITTELALPGKAFVYLPQGGYVAISRKIEDGEQRGYYKDLLAKHLTEREGVIVRTAAIQATEAELLDELEQLRTLWKEVQAEGTGKKAPVCLYQDQALIQRILRDLSALDLAEIIVDQRGIWKQIEQTLKLEHVHWQGSLQLYQGVEDLFSTYGVEREISRLLDHLVWLRSGGFLMIDQTEALTVVDVNTGKYTGKSTLEETIYRTNLEAAQEIARQLRLREISGIILIDFIDMQNQQHQTELLQVLERALRQDRTRTEIMGLTRLGLVEMTRKKTIRSMQEEYLQDCSCCKGSGRVLQHHIMVDKLHRQLKEYERGKHCEIISIALHPTLFHHIESQLGWSYWEDHFPMQLFWREDALLPDGTYKILYTGDDEELAKTIR